MNYHFLAGLVLGAVGAIFVSKNKNIKDFAKNQFEKAKNGVEDLKDFAFEGYEKISQNSEDEKSKI